MDEPNVLGSERRAGRHEGPDVAVGLAGVGDMWERVEHRVDAVEEFPGRRDRVACLGEDEGAATVENASGSDRREGQVDEEDRGRAGDRDAEAVVVQLALVGAGVAAR
ncbi:hypothetical protein [Agromyces sp. CCNWLW203]|uniref:hypothetical protein n=1 Tax=Agromyces sp. CCNWLW203 TaxID=3112842 RepID=UPI002F9647BD